MNVGYWGKKGGGSLGLIVWSCFTRRIKGCSEGRVPQSSSILLWDSDSQVMAEVRARGDYGWEACFGQSSSKEPMCCSCVLKTPCALSWELTELCFSSEPDFTPRKRNLPL